MKWQEAPEELKVLLEEAMKSIQREKSLTFGYPAYFISTPAAPNNIRARANAWGRPMNGYFVLPEALYRDARAFTETTADAADYARTLAPKKKAARARSSQSRKHPQSQ